VLADPKQFLTGEGCGGICDSPALQRKIGSGGPPNATTAVFVGALDDRSNQLDYGRRIGGSRSLEKKKWGAFRPAFSF